MKTKTVTDETDSRVGRASETHESGVNTAPVTEV